MTTRALRYSGIAAVVVLWTTLSVATARSGFDLYGGRPLSYLAEQPRAALLFGAGLVVGALLLYGFHHHIRDRYAVGSGFSATMCVGLAGQVVAGLVPIGGNGLSHSVHTTSALVLGASLPVFMWRFAAGQRRGRWRRATYALFWAEVVACGAGLYLSGRGVAPVAEVLPAAVFHLWIATLTFRPWPGQGADGSTAEVVRADLAAARPGSAGG